MYKIFFNDKYLLISDYEEHTNSTTRLKQQIVSDVESIRAVVNKFLATTSGDPVRLVSLKGAKWVFDELCGMFYFLEAAGGLVENSRGEWLFIYRFEKWDLPKGKSKKGEDKLETAIREVTEETSLEGMKIICALEDTYHIYPYKSFFALKKTSWFHMHYPGKAQAKPQAEEGITKVSWVPASDVAALAAQSYPSLKEMIAATEYFTNS